jgi:hypothetical protein
MLINIITRVSNITQGAIVEESFGLLTGFSKLLKQFAFPPPPPPPPVFHRTRVRELCIIYRLESQCSITYTILSYTCCHRPIDKGCWWLGIVINCGANLSVAFSRSRELLTYFLEHSICQG